MATLPGLSSLLRLTLLQSLGSSRVLDSCRAGGSSLDEASADRQPAPDVQQRTVYYHLLQVQLADSIADNGVGRQLADFNTGSKLSSPGV